MTNRSTADVAWTLHGSLGDLVGVLALVCCAFGLWLAVRPRGFMEWIGRIYKPIGLPSNPEDIGGVRLLGGGFISASALFVIAWILLSLH